MRITIGTKILPVSAIDDIYILGKVDIDTYSMAFILYTLRSVKVTWIYM